MYAITYRNYIYDDGYWDFWTYNNKQEAEDDLPAFKGDEVKVVNLDESSPEADFVNKKLAEDS